MTERRAPAIPRSPAGKYDLDIQPDSVPGLCERFRLTVSRVANWLPRVGRAAARPALSRVWKHVRSRGAVTKWCVVEQWWRWPAEVQRHGLTPLDRSHLLGSLAQSRRGFFDTTDDVARPGTSRIWAIAAVLLIGIVTWCRGRGLQSLASVRIEASCWHEQSAVFFGFRFLRFYQRQHCWYRAAVASARHLLQHFARRPHVIHAALTV